MQRVVTLLGLVVGAGACGLDNGDDLDDVAEVSSSVVVENKLSANKLSANKLSANKLSANKLSANKLSANKLELNQVGANELLATEGGREVLSFIISCAVKEGNSLVAEFEGDTYEFFGEVGLANDWLHHEIDDAGAGWVSACLFSRVNALNVPIPISLRGPSANLKAGADERAGWPLQEGAFYGNFFVEENQPINWNACMGEDQAAGETGGLVSRNCTEPCTPGDVIDDNGTPEPEDDQICGTNQTKCGFNFAGMCGDFAPNFACARYSDNGTYYSSCLDNPGLDGSESGKASAQVRKTSAKEVITVYVTE